MINNNEQMKHFFHIGAYLIYLLTLKSLHIVIIKIHIFGTLNHNIP